VNRDAPDNYEAAKTERRTAAGVHAEYDTHTPGHPMSLLSLVHMSAARARARVTHPHKRGRR
jgi:hypothetical protein